jgi:hypothetical protein
VETATQERAASRGFEPAPVSNGDAATFSIGVTQRVMGPLTELSIAAAKENARLAAELHIVALEALHDTQSAVLRRSLAWVDGLTDPMHLYHRGFLESLESMRRALTFMSTTARLVTQAADRLQTAAMDTGRRIHESVESCAKEAARR